MALAASAFPASPSLVDFAVALPVVLLVAYGTSRALGVDDVARHWRPSVASFVLGRPSGS